MKDKMCIDCKYYDYNVIERGSGRYAEPYCKLDPEQVVYLFTECLIGKWEAKDEQSI